MTCHVPEWMKSWMPLKVLAITEGFFLLRSRRETRVRRSPPRRRRRRQRRSACRQRSPSYALILGEIGQEVKGTGDKDRLAEGTGTTQGLSRVFDRLDLSEERSPPPGQVRGREGTLVARAGGHEPIAEHREGGEHPVDVLVRENRGDDDVAGGRQPRQEIPEAGEIVGAVPDLERIVAQSLESARELHVDVP